MNKERRKEYYNKKLKKHHYDFNQADKSGIDDPVYNTTIGIIPRWKKFNNILDLGCNCGAFTNRLLKELNPKSIIGLEVSSEAIKIAKQNYPGINFICSDIIDMEFDKKFDLIMASGVLNFNFLTGEEYKSCIKRINRLLKPNGYFVEQNNHLAMKGSKYFTFAFVERYFRLLIHIDFYMMEQYCNPEDKGHQAMHRWVRLYQKID